MKDPHKKKKNKRRKRREKNIPGPRLNSRRRDVICVPPRRVRDHSNGTEVHVSAQHALEALGRRSLLQALAGPEPRVFRSLADSLPEERAAHPTLVSAPNTWTAHSYDGQFPF